MHLFRNITAFAFPSTLDFSKLEPALELLAFQPCAPQALSSEGFVPVEGEGTAAARFARLCSGAILVAVQTETRILPPRVVDERLRERLLEIEATQGRQPSGGERRRLKDDVVAELLSRSFTVKDRTRALLDIERGLLLVDTSSRKAAERIASHLRSALGSFPCVPLSFRTAPSQWMSRLVRDRQLPPRFCMGESCVLKGPDASQVTIKKLDLGGEEVLGHLTAGMTVSRLAMESPELFAFELDEALVVRRFDCQAEVEVAGGEDPLAALDAQVFLLVQHYRQLIDMLDEQLGINFAS
ncbi:recombination-associated protein RdgC (plasmid) [Xanthomonas citri pv. citri]|uniref:recombination-associated protein RdgC n=1 Tax=Xanthomonas citri TaxID=346 RepID=UPI0019317901|nr:recombination-associated protein RdgC [Xanthomonas citri]QRD62712.1 recombination-associated protein RdgC [Xanthomonas citri pv. citri]QRD67039.1 recombination-associated protein RdgC [Xanthomonas citri pv. citri]QRD71708.1 recombination-associated protein RdgC [Xanthomonas citri pv. citri]